MESVASLGASAVGAVSLKHNCSALSDNQSFVILASLVPEV